MLSIVGTGDLYWAKFERTNPASFMVGVSFPRFIRCQVLRGGRTGKSKREEKLIRVHTGIEFYAKCKQKKTIDECEQCDIVCHDHFPFMDRLWNALGSY